MNTSDREKLLTPGELALILTAVLPIFFFLGGPVWTHPYRIDAAVYWSYAPVPALVLAVLFRRRVLSVAGFLVNTITALSIKYLVTTTAAFALWTVFDPPALAVAAPESELAERNDEARRSRANDEGALEIDFNGSAITPQFVEVGANQALIFRSLDRQLHTVRAIKEDGSVLFNRPVIPGRNFEAITLPKGAGRVSLSCAVHEHELHGSVLSTSD